MNDFFNDEHFSNLHFEFTGRKLDEWNNNSNSVNDVVKEWIDTLELHKICFRCMKPFKESETLGSLPCVTHFGKYGIEGWSCCKQSDSSLGCIPCSHVTQPNWKFTKTSRIEIPNLDVIKIPEHILDNAIKRGKIYDTFVQTSTSICFYTIDRKKIEIFEKNKGCLAFRQGHDLIKYGRLLDWKTDDVRPYNSSQQKLFMERYGHMIDHAKNLSSSS